MSDLNFMASVMDAVHSLENDLKAKGVCLDYQIQARGEKSAVVTVTVGPAMWFCPECQKPSTSPQSEWRNTPGISGVRYVCPECYARLTTQGSGRA
jgi:hypothetical protein